MKRTSSKQGKGDSNANTNGLQVDRPFLVTVESLDKATGSASNINATAGTLTLSIPGWGAHQLTMNGTLNVVTNSSTYFNLNGQGVSQSDWFAALTTTTKISVIGTYSRGTLTALAVVIGDDTSGLGHAP